MLSSGDAMTRVWQKPPVVARPMFTHADIIISRVSLQLEAFPELCMPAGFDLHRWATDTFAVAFVKADAIFPRAEHL
jgi:hypothetical protein